MVKTPIYMDYHATTPLDPRVLDRMMPFLTGDFGNAASRSHTFGWKAEEAVEYAREQVAALIGASEKEIVWTSGATESINLALKGVAEFYKEKGNHLITVTTEHKATLDSMKRLERQGCEVTYLPVATDGLIDLAQLEGAITDKTILVSVMAGNNEIGVVQPIAEIGALCRRRGVLFHTDAVQVAGKLPLDVEAMKIDLMSISAHKMYGPKGVGALYVRRRNPRVRLEAIQDGGGHERGMRSGTLNVTGIVGFGKACELAMHEMDTERERLLNLRRKLERELSSRLEVVQVNGHAERRLPHILNISFGYVEGESLLMGIKDIACSSGSACTSASLEPSYVLKSLGVGDELAHSSLRLSLGRWSTEEEVDYAVEGITKAVNHLRTMSPLWDLHKEGIDVSKIEWQTH